MAKLTNISGTPRALPLKSGGFVEFAKGETKDFPDADFAPLSKRGDVTDCFSVEDFAEPEGEPKSKGKGKAAKDAE